MTIEAATSTEVFHSYVREVLVPSLRLGGIVVLDNLGAHKNERTLELIKQAGAKTRFLPAYSPVLDTIEMMWSKVKALLRKGEARNHPELLKTIAAAFATVTSQDALGWFARCGYIFIKKTHLERITEFKKIFQKQAAGAFSSVSSMVNPSGTYSSPADSVRRTRRSMTWRSKSPAIF